MREPFVLDSVAQAELIKECIELLNPSKKSTIMTSWKPDENIEGVGTDDSEAGGVGSGRHAASFAAQNRGLHNAIRYFQGWLRYVLDPAEVRTKRSNLQDFPPFKVNDSACLSTHLSCAIMPLAPTYGHGVITASLRLQTWNHPLQSRAMSTIKTEAGDGVPNSTRQQGRWRKS